MGNSGFNFGSSTVLSGTITTATNDGAFIELNLGGNNRSYGVLHADNASGAVTTRFKSF